jgi:predicted NBD/HSP70 family sugar kinase
MGILLEGKVYYGPRMAAGGLGQMVIAASSGCHDRSGCLELLVSNPAICDRYSALAGAQEPLSLGDATARVRQIARLATNGDMLAQRVIEESGRYLGIGIANIVWAIDAEVIVIDGAITEAWRLIEPPLRAQLSSFRGLLVEPSALRGKAASIGAAMLVWSKEFMRSCSSI